MAQKPARRTLQQQSRSPFGVVVLCFFVSGATALVYEVVWLRMLSLVFGHTVYAITTVLAAFMAGLGLGSVLLGRRIERFSDPIRVYGLLELGIGISCAMLPVLIWLASSVYLGLARALSASHVTLGFAQFVLVFAILMVPTTLMGGTLPVLSQAATRGGQAVGRTVGALYAVNTFGAVVGVVLAGYGLLPAIGNRSTLWIAVAANVAIGLVAIAYSRSVQASGPRVAQPPVGSSVRWEPGAWIVAAALGVSGAVSMIYEVTWTRALALVIGSSTYAFTAMLAAFLLGIAGGAALYSWRWGAGRAGPAAFGLIQAGIGVAAAVVLLVFDRFPELFLLALDQSLSPAFVEPAQLVTSVLTLLPTTLLIGATFPCAMAACIGTPAHVGQDVGRLYAVNTLGAIAGAILAGFVLVPAVGVHASVKLGILINLALAVVLCIVGSRPVTRWRWSVAGVSVLVAACVTVIPAWDGRAMSSGPALYARDYLARSRAAGMRAVLHSTDLLFYRDGPSATVSVVRTGEWLSLRVNGKSDASTVPTDMPTQLMLGHLPLLLHPDPRAVLVIGLGGGITAGAVARHPIERLDIVEIEPAVIEASRFFTRDNGDVLGDPRVRMTIADGRNHLLTTRERYDVIISEPSNPWIGGVASLFSVEFFELARRALKPGGVMAQWVQAYNLAPPDFQMVVKTLRTVFPATTVWHVANPDFLLLGRTTPAPVDLELLKSRHASNAALRRDLERIEINDWPGVLGQFMLGEADTARYVDGAPVNTDDRLPLEFSAPRALYLDTVIPNWSLMKRFRVAELPETTTNGRSDLERAPARYAIGSVYLGRGVLSEAFTHFQRALEIDPSYTPALLGSGTVYLRAGRPADALARARQVLASDPRNVEALLIASLASAKLNDATDARTLLNQALGLRPASDIDKAIAKLLPAAPTRR